jgi:hypothetical protein
VLNFWYCIITMLVFPRVTFAIVPITQAQVFIVDTNLLNWKESHYSYHTIKI